jgi:hypothetical protein
MTISAPCWPPSRPPGGPTWLPGCRP